MLGESAVALERWEEGERGTAHQDPLVLLPTDQQVVREFSTPGEQQECRP